MATKWGETYYICNGCGADSRDDESEYPQWMTLEVTNILTGEDVMLGMEDHHICSECWCRVQDVIDRAHRQAHEVAAIADPECACTAAELSHYGCPIHGLVSGGIRQPRPAITSTNPFQR